MKLTDLDYDQLLLSKEYQQQRDAVFVSVIMQVARRAHYLHGAVVVLICSYLSLRAKIFLLKNHKSLPNLKLII